MRGAGCVYNDIVDADLDRQVARTASRPVASGRVSAQGGVGLAVRAVRRRARGAVPAAARGAARRARQPRAGRRLSVHEADHLVAAGLARAGVHLGRAGRVDRAALGPARRARRALCRARSSGASATTRSTRCRTARTMRWSASARARCGSASNVQAGRDRVLLPRAEPVGPRVLAAARGLAGAARAAAGGAAPDVAGVHARPGRSRQPARPLPLEPLRRPAGGRRPAWWSATPERYSAGCTCTRRGRAHASSAGAAAR